MTAAQKYQQLVDAGLLVPPLDPPSDFKFPTMQVQVPTNATNGVLDREQIEKVQALNAQLERHSK